MGMFVIAMSLGASFGFCFYIGLYFGDMHPAIPFLLLGIGVDDMFVIVQAVENLSASERKLPIHQRIGKAMRHAGVSITVTSVTDMAAFLIGSTSVRIEMRTHYTAIFFWSPPSFFVLCRVCPYYVTFASSPPWESFFFMSLPSRFSSGK